MVTSDREIIPIMIVVIGIAKIFAKSEAVAKDLKYMIVSGVVSIWQEIETESISHTRQHQILSLIYLMTFFRWGWIKKIPSIALYESWKLMDEGADGFRRVIIKALIDSALIPFFSLPSIPPSS